MPSSPLERLRQKLWLEPIPDTVHVPAIGDRIARTMPIERASVDDIEFAMVELGRQQSELSRIAGAMEDVLKMARRQGACGTDVAISAAVREMEERN